MLGYTKGLNFGQLNFMPIILVLWGLLFTLKIKLSKQDFINFKLMIENEISKREKNFPPKITSRSQF